MCANNSAGSHCHTDLMMLRGGRTEPAELEIIIHWVAILYFKQYLSL